MPDLMCFAAKFIRNGQALILRFSCHATWQVQAFSRTYSQVAYG
ncbi:hypothetical protein [uncultured Desulfuromusa sp.]|nr:hypothetical protein [uncultured Desulfuromusa sp.]